MKATVQNLTYIGVFYLDKIINQHTKLGEVYKNLIGVNLTIEDMDLPVSVYNYLKRGGIDHLQQILLMSEADLAKFSFARRNCAYLVSWLAEESGETNVRKTPEKYFDRKPDEE